SPAAKDDRVRKAVAMALDRDAILQLSSNTDLWESVGRTIAWGHNNVVPYALQGFWVEPTGSEMGAAAQWSQHNPKAAKELLAAAGFPDGLDIDFHRTVTAYGPTYDTVVEAIPPMLTEGGFRPSVKVEDYRGSWQTIVWD